MYRDLHIVFKRIAIITGGMTIPNIRSLDPNTGCYNIYNQNPIINLKLKIEHPNNKKLGHFHL